MLAVVRNVIAGYLLALVSCRLVMPSEHQAGRIGGQAGLERFTGAGQGRLATKFRVRGAGQDRLATKFRVRGAGQDRLATKFRFRTGDVAKTN